VSFFHYLLSSTIFEGYVWWSVPHVSAFAQRFPVFTRIPCHTSQELPIVPSYQQLFSRGNEEGKRQVFGAANPADQPVESAREKATKQIGQKVSHKTISVSVERAIRGSRQRTTQTVWRGKESPWKACQRPHQKLWKKVVGTQGYLVERSLSMGCEKVLEKPFKSMEKPISKEDGKSLFERLRTWKKHDSFASLFEEEMKVSLTNYFLLTDDTAPRIHRKRLSSLLSAHEKL
jgi:hypothetical protein